MNILQVSAHDVRGGAARVAYSLHKAFSAQGHDARFMVRCQSSRDLHVHSANGWGLLHAVEEKLEGIEARTGLQSLTFPSSLALPLRSVFRSSDVVHLHNIHGSAFSLAALPIVCRARPVVWTLHDMWAVTGHCAHPLECRRYHEGCGACPHLDLPPAMSRDATAAMWLSKRAIYRACPRAAGTGKPRLVAIAPSLWLKGIVDESPLGRLLECRHIPNGVDTFTFRPIDKTAARKILGLPATAPIVALSSAPPAAIYKGPEHFRRLIEILPQALPGAVALVFGEASGCRVATGSRQKSRGKLVETGWVDDDRLLALYLAAADVYAMTSVAENAPLSVLEAMACGTPVAAFRVGGIPEVVRDGETGLLSEPGDTQSLCAGIARIAADQKLAARLSKAARKTMTEEFGLDIQARRYLDLYQELLATDGH